jgi:hypothetical protein
VSGIYSVIYALTGHSPLRRFPRLLQLMHSLLYSSIITFPFIVTAVFWSLISAPPHKKVFSTTTKQWSNVSFHCLNSVFAFFEIVFSAVLPQRWTHSIVILGIMILYVAMAYLIRLSAGFYVYDFLDTRMVGALIAAYIFGIGAMGVITFFAVQGIVWVKGIMGGKRVWRSQYDLPRWEFDQRTGGSRQATGGKFYMTDVER